MWITLWIKGVDNSWIKGVDINTQKGSSLLVLSEEDPYKYLWGVAVIRLYGAGGKSKSLKAAAVGGVDAMQLVSVLLSTAYLSASLSLILTNQQL